MADPVIPAPPPGFTLQTDTPPPPPGFTMDSSPATKIDDTPTNVGKTAGDQVKRVAGAAVETPLHVASGMLATPLAGLAGIVDTVFEGGEEGAKTVGTVQNSLTYSARTEGGKLGTEAVDTGLGLISKAGEKAGDFTLKHTGSPAAAAAVDTAVQSIPAALGARGPKGIVARVDPMRVAAHEAQSEGLVLPANQARPNLLNNLADSVAGKIKTQQLASLKNQSDIQNLVKRGLGVKPDVEWNETIPKQVRQEAGKAYEALKDPTLPRIHPGVKFYDELSNVLGKYKEAGRTFKRSAKSPIQESIRDLAADIRDSKGFNPGEGQAMAEIFRENATDAFRNGETGKGLAFKRMAKAIEDEIDRGLPKEKSDLIKNYQQARQRIAQAHAVESAMSPVTGNIDLAVMGRALKKGEPFTGDLKKAAGFGLAFPKAVQLPEKIGDYSDYSPLDVGVGILAEAGEKASKGNINEAGAVLSRAPIRHALLSDWYQSHFGKAPSPAQLQKIQKSLSRIPKEKQVLYLEALAGDKQQ